jgi:hypothetical protein
MISTLRHNQVAPASLSSTWLSSNVASMTRHLHHTVAKSHRQCRRQHDLTTLLPAWLNIYITPQSNRLGNFITSRTRQRRCQHDSTSTTHNSLIININKILLQRQANTLPALSSTIHHYVWFLSQCKHPVALLGTSMKHLIFKDLCLKTLSSTLLS